MESVQILLQGFGPVPVEGVDALAGCTVAVRSPGGAVAGEDIQDDLGVKMLVNLEQ